MSDIKTWTFAGNFKCVVHILNNPNWDEARQDALVTGVNGSAIYIVREKVNETEYTYDFKSFYPETNKDNGNVHINYSVNGLYLDGKLVYEYEKEKEGAVSVSIDTANDDIFTSSIPIFDANDQASIDNYRKNADDSGRINPIQYYVKWTLYIDGKSNPLYKLTWDCENLKDVDTSNTTIAIWVGSFNSLNNSFNDEDGTKFKEIPYNNKSCKFSYNDISKLVDQPLIGHNPACIRVQLACRKFETARAETSTSMGCDLYYSSDPQGYLYDVIGYLTLTDGVWYKTTEGDGSTFTVKDGKEGSDGYTDDNDNGYNDGKDNDEKDTDTGDVSAGIGVLTSTFKMTK